MKALIGACLALLLVSSQTWADSAAAFKAYQAGDFKSAFARAAKAAKTADPLAWHLLGALYMRGEGVPQDKEKAFSYFRKAAAKGLAAAQYNLGIAYALGSGTKPDYALARKWYRKAALQNHIKASFDLGWLYRKGLGGRQDDIKAAKWIGKAANAGHVAAQLEYAFMIFKGEGVEQDIPVAIAWFRRAAQGGNVVAQNRLARLYAMGYGVEQDEVEAAKWHFLAKKGGDADEKMQRFVGSLTKEEIAEARTRVREFEKTFPALKQASAEIITKDGKKHEITLDYPLGDYREPMDMDTLLKKFDAMVLPLTGQEKRDRIVNAVMSIEQENDVADFMALLAK